MCHEPNESTLTIGQLGIAVGLNPKTIRYYEEVGLVPLPARNRAGYRVYTADARACLGFIIKAKATGLTLAEIGELLALRRDGQPPCVQLRVTLDRKLAVVEAQLRALTDFRHELLALRASAAASDARTGAVCGVIERHSARREHAR